MARGIKAPPFTGDDVLNAMAWWVVNRYKMPEKNELAKHFGCDYRIYYRVINRMREDGMLDILAPTRVLYTVKDKQGFRERMRRQLDAPLPPPPVSVETKESRAGAKRYDSLIRSFAGRVRRH
jgi:hypothetical protein